MGTTPPPPTINDGDIGMGPDFICLVLAMTAPGLALFYGGMVRRKNVISMLMQCFMCLSIVSVLWVVIAYSLAFGHRSRVDWAIYRWFGLVHDTGVSMTA